MLIYHGDVDAVLPVALSVYGTNKIAAENSLTVWKNILSVFLNKKKIRTKDIHQPGISSVTSLVLERVSSVAQGKSRWMFLLSG